MEEIRNRIVNDLSIRRLPKNTKNRFIEFASEDEFSSDYGMALKYLVDFHDGLMQQGNELVMEQLEILNQRIIELESKINKSEEPKKRTMLSGKGM